MKSKTNQAGINLIKEFEGCKLEVYKDIANILTVGYGHVTKDLKLGDRISQSMADRLLEEDLHRFEAGVDSLLFVEPTDNEFSALVSFAFNVGLNNLRVSTLLKRFNNGDNVGAANEFLRWNKAGGKVVEGLSRRRAAEAKLFLLA